MVNIIVGGGITGLLTAYNLLINNKEEVVVIEKGKNLGGLLADTEIEGKKIDRFYHHIFKSDTKAIDLIKKLGLGSRLKWHESSVSIYFNGMFRPFMSPKDLLTFGPIKFVDRLKTGIVTLYLQKSNRWKSFEKISAYKWMKKYGGDSAYKVIWEPLLKSKFGDKYKKVSMAWLWARIYLRGKSSNGGVEELGYVKDGFGQIVDKLEQEIVKNGGRIIKGSEVVKITRRKKDLLVDTNNGKYLADRVIVTVANDQMAKMIKVAKIKNKLNKIGYVGVINVLFSTDQNLTDYYWNNINDLKSPFVALVKQSQLVGKYNGKHVYYLGAYIDSKNELYQKTDDEIIDVFMRYLKAVNPNFRQEEVNQVKIFKFPRAQQITTSDYQNNVVDFKTGIEGVYLINFAQIYPWDRGINWAIDRVEKLLSVLS